MGRVRRVERARARTSSSRAWATVKAVNGWTAAPRVGRRGSGTDRRPGPASAGRGRCRGRSGTRRAGRWRATGRRRRSRRSPTRPGPACRRSRPLASATCASTPRSRPTARSIPMARSGRALRAAGWRPAAPIQPASTRIIDLRAGRGGPAGRPAQEVAPVREQGAERRDRGRRRRWRPAGRLLPDLPRDGRPRRLPDPDRGGVPRHLGCVPRRPVAPGSCSPRRPTASRRRRSSWSAAGPASSSRTAA